MLPKRSSKILPKIPPGTSQRISLYNTYRYSSFSKTYFSNICRNSSQKIHLQTFLKGCILQKLYQHLYKDFLRIAPRTSSGTILRIPPKMPLEIFFIFFQEFLLGHLQTFLQYFIRNACSDFSRNVVRDPFKIYSRDST